MPRRNGIEATDKIRKEWPDTLIIGLSVNASPGYQELMQRAGADALVPKDLAGEQLYDAVHDAMKRRNSSSQVTWTDRQ